MWQPNAETRSMSVGIPTLILAIIAKQCHKQANKHFGEGFSRNVALYH